MIWRCFYKDFSLITYLFYNWYLYDELLISFGGVSMSNKLTTDQSKHHISNGTAIGAAAGAILGILAVLFDRVGIYSLLGQRFSSLSRPGYSIIVVIALCIAGAIAGLLTELYIIRTSFDEHDSYEANRKISNQNIYKTLDSRRLKLLEEKLDISKKQVQTGDVKIHKEVVTEEKNFTIPLNREELVIEKKIITPNDIGDNNYHTETIRIPISEERAEFIKHTVPLEDVSISKHQFQEIKTVEETLKKEKLHVDTDGTPKIVYKNPKND